MVRGYLERVNSCLEAIGAAILSNPECLRAGRSFGGKALFPKEKGVSRRDMSIT
jgi:hypothetical protein